MTALIGEVTWGQVWRHLVAATMPSSLGWIVAGCLEDDLVIDHHQAFARLITARRDRPDLIAEAIRVGAPGLDDDHVATVAAWALNAAHLVERYHAALAIDLPAVPPARPVGLEIDDALADIAWPLRALVDDLADRGGLRIAYVPVPAGVSGARFDPRTLTIEVDPDAFVRRRHLLEGFVHELAHAIDPRLGRVSPADEEAYAEAGARILLEADPPPTTVTEARALLVDLDRARCDLVADELVPSASAMSIVRFRMLDLSVTSSSASPREAGHGRPAPSRGGLASTPGEHAGEGRPAGDLEEVPAC